MNLFDPTGHSPKTVAVNLLVGATGSVYTAAKLPLDTLVGIATIVYLVISTVGAIPKAVASIKAAVARVQALIAKFRGTDGGSQ